MVAHSHGLVVVGGTCPTAALAGGITSPPFVSFAQDDCRGFMVNICDDWLLAYELPPKAMHRAEVMGHRLLSVA